MVRFHRDRWYSADGQSELHRRSRQQSSSGSVKIIKLCGLLALVLVLMHQLSQDEWVDRWITPVVGQKETTLPHASSKSESETEGDGDNAAPRPRTIVDSGNGLNRDGQVSISSSSSLKTSSSEDRPVDTSATTESDPLGELQVSIWEQLLAECSQLEINNLGTWWFGLRGDDVSSDPSSEQSSNVGWTERRLRSLDTRLNDWHNAFQGSAETSADAEALRQFMLHWPNWREWLSGPTVESFANLATSDRVLFEQALDRLLLKTLRDASPWRKVENAAFRRGLELARSKQLQGSGADLRMVEALSLMGDFQSYRGEWVRFRGTLADGPFNHAASGDGFGPTEFWIVWLQPTDSSTQPICVYLAEPLPELPVPMNAQAVDANTIQEPILEVDARPMKKLAYASKQGVDVAPVLISSQARWIPSEEPNRLSSGIPQPRAERLVWKAPKSLRPLIELLSQSFATGRSELSPTLLEVLNRGGNQSLPSAMLRYLKQLERYQDLIDQVLRGEEPLPNDLSLVERNAIVTGMQVIEVPSEHQAWSESRHCIRLVLQRDLIDDDPPIYAYVRNAPRFWNDQNQLLQPVRVQGLRVGGQRNQDSALLISKLQWTCWEGVLEIAQWVPPLPTNWLRLARWGLDLNEIDQLSQLQTKSLDESESHAFYTLLRLTKEWPSDSFQRMTPEAFMELLRNPKNRMLDELELTMKVIRVTRVYVPEGKEQAWAESDAYFQIDGMADIGNVSVSMSGKKDGEPVIFESKYPVTLITSTLPTWLAHVEGSRFNADPMRSLDNADVWYPTAEVQARGIFYRLWGYSSQATLAPGFSGKQFGPLLFATSILPSSVQSAETIKSQLNWLNVMILLLTIGIVAWGWIMARAKIAKNSVRFFASDSRQTKLRQQGTILSGDEGINGTSGSSQDS